jgi:hypothetical protein
MANSERSFQTELLIEMRRQGWHCFKITTPFMIGVPDLYIKAALRPPVWLELKYMKSPGKVDLTPLQRKFMRDENKVGGRAGWAVCVEGGHLYVGANPDIISLSDHNSLYLLQHRERGEAWNVQAILERIINGDVAS